MPILRAAAHYYDDGVQKCVPSVTSCDESSSVSRLTSRRLEIQDTLKWLIGWLRIDQSKRSMMAAGKGGPDTSYRYLQARIVRCAIEVLK